jgi:hypothetical protein
MRCSGHHENPAAGAGFSWCGDHWQSLMRMVFWSQAWPVRAATVRERSYSSNRSLTVAALIVLAFGTADTAVAHSHSGVVAAAVHSLRCAGGRYAGHEAHERLLRGVASG